MKVVAIIPARSGSKGLPNKNILNFKGKPLLAHSIEQAKESELIDRVIVSTDSPEYAEIALRYGAEVPFLRPDNISGDLTLDIEVFSHCDNFLSRQSYYPEIYVHLRPTYPLRSISDINFGIEILKNNTSIDSFRTVCESEISPYKMYLMSTSNTITPVATCDIPDAINSPRQLLPRSYIHNGCIDLVRRSVIQSGSMTGKTIYGHVMKHNFDIDTLEDFIRAENYKSN